jgi:phosphotransferase system enzyme I (PtsI)
LGVTELSMHPSAIPVIKNIIRGSSLAEMQGLAEDVIEAEDVDEAERLVIAQMRARFPEHLEHGGGAQLWSERSEAPTEVVE